MTPQLPNLCAFYEHCLRTPREQTISVDGERHPWDPLTLHASDLGAALPPEDDNYDGCLRQLKYRLLGTPGKQRTPGEMLMLYKASLIHVLFAHWLETRIGEMYPDWQVAKIESVIDAEGSGRLDVLLLHASGFRLVVDFKSVRGNAFRYARFPYRGHVVQVQRYMMAEQADAGLILYTDREGQNFQVQCEIGRDDAAVRACWATLQQVAAAPELPAVLPPKTTTKETKTKGTSVTTDLRWNCQYCPFLDVACASAIPPHLRGKVAGHVQAEEDLKPLLERMVAAGSLNPEGDPS